MNASNRASSKHPSTASLALIPLAMAAAFSSGWGQKVKEQVVSISPYQAESGKAFQVTLSGKTDLCNPRFSHWQVQVGEGTLSLTVLAENDPVAKCAAGPHDYATDFSIPAMKAGSYEVNAFLPPACAFAPNPCPIAYMPLYGGTLTVQDSAKLNFAIRPKQVAADKEFDLFVTHKDFTCGNEFSNLSSYVSGHSLYVQFTNRPHPEALCPAVLTDHGPTIKVPAMKGGVYQVFATAMPYCGTPGPCPLALMAPQLAGALTVGDGATAIFRPADNGSREGSEIGNNGKAEKGRLRFDTRLGVMGWWRGAAVTLTGRSQ